MTASGGLGIMPMPQPTADQVAPTRRAPEER
jgi:hypothetical protein